MDGKSEYIHLHNIHYCPELNSNFLLLGILKKKDLSFLANKAVSISKTIKETLYYGPKKQGLYTFSYNQLPSIIQYPPLIQFTRLANWL